MGLPANKHSQKNVKGNVGDCKPRDEKQALKKIMVLPCWDIIQKDMLKCGVLLLLVAQNSTLVLTMRYSRSTGDNLYSASTAVVMSELTKLVAASALIGVEEGSVKGFWNKVYLQIVSMPAEFVKLLVPACLYTLQSNLLFIAVSNLDAMTYQVLYQLKILTTAIFSVVLLRRRLHMVQWLSLLVLVAGVALVQVSGLKSADGDIVTAATGSMTTGLVALTLACCSSGFAGVYFEKVLKGSEVSLWVRNVQLALIGIVAGLGGVWYSDAEKIAAHGFFHGYSPVVWSVIALQAVGGILVALVVKYADSLLKGFSTAFSIVASCLVSYLFLEEGPPSPKFVLGVLLVMFSTVLYSLNPLNVYFSYATCCNSKDSIAIRTYLSLISTIGKHDNIECVPLTDVYLEEEEI